MLFTTTNDHEELRAAIRGFAETKVKPIAFSLDKESKFPTEIVKEMGENGWMGLPYPKEYGGAGMDYIAYAIAVEELARVDGGVGVILSAHVSLGSYPIFAFGTEEQKQKYLVPLAKGEKIGAFGLTEPNAGSDAGGTETTAVFDGKNWILNGNKIFITNGGAADIYIIFAMTDKSKGNHGITAFILEDGMPGFTFGKKEDKMGIHTSQTMELVFQDVKVPAENMLGEEGKGFKIAMMTLDGGRIGVAAQALGIAQGALDAAVKYSKEREQFGRSICKFQALSFKMADMAMKIEAARLLVYRAANLKNEGKPYSAAAAMAKCFASDVAMEVTTDAVQIFGGYGYTVDYPAERYMRNAKITQIYEGTNEVQRMVISRDLLSDKKKK